MSVPLYGAAACTTLALSQARQSGRRSSVSKSVRPLKKLGWLTIVCPSTVGDACSPSSQAAHTGAGSKASRADASIGL